MTEKITPFHTIICNSVIYDSSTDSWFIHYRILDIITKKITESSFQFDRTHQDKTTSPAEIFVRLINYLKKQIKENEEKS